MAMRQRPARALGRPAAAGGRGGPAPARPPGRAPGRPGALRGGAGARRPRAGAGGREPGLPRGEAEEEAEAEEAEAGPPGGSSVAGRFVAPRVDDVGLPVVDAIVAGVLAPVSLATGVLASGVPAPSWLLQGARSAIALGVPQWRSLPYVFGCLPHGAGLAGCWLLGALAARGFEREKYTGEALATTVRAGAFAVGLLVLATQASFQVTLLTEDLSLLGPDPAAVEDFLRVRAASELVVDVTVEALFLIAWRQARATLP